MNGANVGSEANRSLGESRIALDRLSREDVRILKLEAGAIRGHTCKAIVLERYGQRPLPTLDVLRAHIDARLDGAQRLRKRLVSTPLGVNNPIWVDDPHFEIARHVTRVQPRRPPNRSELQEIVAGVMAQRLDRAHPLWHLSVVEELEDGTMALIWRIHHCMADGTACMRLMSSVLWSEEPDEAGLPETSWQPEPCPGTLDLLALGLKDRLRRRGAAVEHGSRRQLSSLLGSRTIVRRELGPSAVHTPLNKRAGSEREVAFARAPLLECKRAAKAIDEAVTLNDVVLALVAGGVRMWLEHGRGQLSGVRVKIPVSLHQRGQVDTIANHDSYFFVDLPVAEPDPVKRVLAINRETRERKLDHDAETLYRLGTHPFLAHWAMSPHVFTFNVSNVPGPAAELYICGARIRELYSLAEIAHHHALRVAVVSAAGSLFFGLCADRAAVQDLGMIADGISRTTEKLLQPR